MCSVSTVPGKYSTCTKALAALSLSSAKECLKVETSSLGCYGYS